MTRRVSIEKVRKTLAELQEKSLTEGDKTTYLTSARIGYHHLKAELARCVLMPQEIKERQELLEEYKQFIRKLGGEISA
jgi:hypothetical protein